METQQSDNTPLLLKESLKYRNQYKKSEHHDKSSTISSNIYFIIISIVTILVWLVIIFTIYSFK